jgi:hypothetical protein
MSDKYIITDDGGLKPVGLMEWAKWFEANPEKRIVRKDSVGDVGISTVFLGMDHRFGENGPPILWETMVFGGKHDNYQERYTSEEDAIVGHEKAVEMAKEDS